MKAGAIGGVLALAGIEVVYALLRWTPWWWLAAAAAFLAAAILLTLVAPVWLVPLFYRLDAAARTASCASACSGSAGAPACPCSASGSAISRARAAPRMPR